jgi:hypothetical protein
MERDRGEMAWCMQMAERESMERGAGALCTRRCAHTRRAPPPHRRTPRITHLSDMRTWPLSTKRMGTGDIPSQRSASCGLFFARFAFLEGGCHRLLTVEGEHLLAIAEL